MTKDTQTYVHSDIYSMYHVSWSKVWSELNKHGNTFPLMCCLESHRIQKRLKQTCLHLKIYKLKRQYVSVAVIQVHVNNTQAFMPFVLSDVCAQKSRNNLDLANGRCWPWFLCQSLELFNGNEKGLSNTGMDKQGSALTIWNLV